MTAADYADYIALLASTSPQADSQLPKLNQRAINIFIYANIDKTKFGNFKQTGAYSILSHKLN